jgi:glycosyltransferase involved in cell wall biosynthesis
VKVLYVIDTLEVGGAERSLYDILSGFRDVTPVVCSLYAGSALSDRYRRAGIPVISLEIRGKYAFGTAIRAFGRVVRRVEPDLIHSTLFRSDIVGRLVGRASGIPVVSSFVNDSYSPLRFRSLDRTGRLKLNAVRAIDRWTARWAAHFIANSEAVRQSNCRALGLDSARSTVIYRGRSPERFGMIGEGERSGIRQELGVPSGAPLMLNVGRLLGRKGQEEAIRAFADVRAAYAGAKLAIAGEGPHRPRLEALVNDLGLSGEVLLLGSREDVPALLAAADLFVFPSHFEGLPGALIEAMLARVPIVATDTPENRECVEHAVSAQLVPIEDSRSLADGIRRLMDDPGYRATLVENAHRRAIETFALDRITRSYEDLYSGLLAARSLPIGPPLSDRSVESPT